MFPPPAHPKAAPADAPAGSPRPPVFLGETGDFYVEAECCISCCIPVEEAPELMAFSEENRTCYFKRQPRTAEETERAIAAVSVGCIGSQRYGGRDPIIISKLYQLGLNSQCDVSLKSVTEGTAL